MGHGVRRKTGQRVGDTARVAGGSKDAPDLTGRDVREEVLKIEAQNLSLIHI